MFQAFFHFFNEAFGHVVVKGQLRVAHDLEGVGRNGVVVEHEKDVVEAKADDVVHKDDVAASGWRGHFNKARALGADRNAQYGIAVLVAAGGLHFDGVVDVTVLKKGQVGALGQHEGNQLGIDDLGEIVAAEIFLPWGELGFVAHPYALILHGGKDAFIRFAKGGLPFGHAVVDAVQGFLRAEAAHEQYFARLAAA